uniref:Calcium ion binding protein, putative n=1 Tax=Arundo donax TaxID=35708 RepID=A0A0A9GJG7_ARUDO
MVKNYLKQHLCWQSSQQHLVWHQLLHPQSKTSPAWTSPGARATASRAPRLCRSSHKARPARAPAAAASPGPATPRPSSPSPPPFFPNPSGLLMHQAGPQKLDLPPRES